MSANVRGVHGLDLHGVDVTKFHSSVCMDLQPWPPLQDNHR
jgi:hypothetical protein